MLIELFDKTHHKKYDFLYLPIDPDVIFNLLRILVILDMLLLTLSTVLISNNFMKYLMEISGNDSIVKRYVD
jgi:hypothetical protein